MLSRLLSGAAPCVGGAFCRHPRRHAVWSVVLGVIAGSTHGLRSAVMNHILDTLLHPSLLLAIIVVAFAGPHLRPCDVRRLAGAAAAHGALRHSMVHDELEKEYIIAARLDGASTLNILLFAILPNIASAW